MGDMKIRRYIDITNIEYSQELMDEVAKGAESVLHWVEKLQEIDIEGVEPMFYVYGDESLQTREDKVQKHASLDEVLLNAPEKEEDVITLPKVVK